MPTSQQWILIGALIAGVVIDRFISWLLFLHLYRKQVNKDNAWQAVKPTRIPQMPPMPIRGGYQPTKGGAPPTAPQVSPSTTRQPDRRTYPQPREERLEIPCDLCGTWSEEVVYCPICGRRQRKGGEG